MNSVRSNKLKGLDTPLWCKDKGIKKVEFVTKKNQFFYMLKPSMGV